MIALIVVISCGFLAVEYWWPAAALPRVRAWYPRVILVNAIQAAIVVVIGAADMLAFRDVHDRSVAPSSPLHLAPTCIGCGKRWACSASRSAL